MTNVSLFRLYALRAGYLLIAVGLAATVWPSVKDDLQEASDPI